MHKTSGKLCVFKADKYDLVILNCSFFIDKVY